MSKVDLTGKYLCDYVGRLADEHCVLGKVWWMEQSCESKPDVTVIADFQAGGREIPLEEIEKGLLCITAFFFGHQHFTSRANIRLGISPIKFNKCDIGSQYKFIVFRNKSF
uniref:Uncharacterized protein n=1 Tax=Micrurus corallinus TaxID=54390 RepID=A0A2D4FKQ4_MICCO